MSGAIVMLVVILLMPLFAIMWNKKRCKGKVVCVVTKEDSSVELGQLGILYRSFIILGEVAFRVYPKRARPTRYPSGWPSILQETMPAFLLNETEAIPLDWVRLRDTSPKSKKESSLKLRTSLDEEIYRTLAHVHTQESGKAKFNFKKALPFVLLAIGVLGLVFLIVSGGIGG